MRKLLTSLLLVNSVILAGCASAAPAATSSGPNGNGDAVMVNGRSLLNQSNDKLNAKNDPFGVKGVGDETAKLQAWVAALAYGGHGVIPCGTYTFSAPIKVYSNTYLDLNSSCVFFTYNGAGNAAFVGQYGNGNIVIHGLALNKGGSANDTTTIGVDMQSVSQWVIDSPRIQGFWKGIRTDGGNGTIEHPFIRSGANAHGVLSPNSASIDVEPYTAPDGTLVCPDGIFIHHPDLGGNDTGPYVVQYGLQISCVDELTVDGGGHIGAVQEDIGVTRIQGQNVQSVLIGEGLYLDGSNYAIHFHAPSGKGPVAGGDNNIDIHPFQISNQLADAIQSEDPTLDAKITTNFDNVAGWALYAPFYNKIMFNNNKLDLVGNGAGLNAGGVEIGVVQSGAPGVGTAGSSSEVMISNNMVFSTKACFFVLNTTYQTVQDNHMPTCTSGIPTRQGSVNAAIVTSNIRSELSTNRASLGATCRHGIDPATAVYIAGIMKSCGTGH